MMAAGDSCFDQLISYLLCMQSWLFGQAIHSIEPDAVTLHFSHGYESPHSKFLMRLTVIASDILGKMLDGAMCWSLSSNTGNSYVELTQDSKLCYAVFFPAVLLCLRVFGGGKTVQEKQWWLLVVLLQPAALLIDHGHFQYNTISLGFAVRCHCLP